MNKQEFKAAKNKLKTEEKQAFLASLPMQEALFPKLFNFLAEQLRRKDCNHTHRSTKAFLARHEVKNAEAVIAWLSQHGGYCDCEVFNNVTEQFDHLQNTWDEPVSIPERFQKILEKKTKINALHTDFGFAIDAVPAPWKLMQSIEGEVKRYYFQIGKGVSNICLAELLTDFPADERTNDDFFKSEAGKTTAGRTIERCDLGDYEAVIVRTQGNTQVDVWCLPKTHTAWYLKVSTEIQRVKGDLKELEKLLKAVK